MAYELATNPFPLGKITLVPGTPKSILATVIADTPALASEKIFANKLDIQIVPSLLAGYAYLGTTGMDKATLANVMKILMPGESFSITHPVGVDVLDLSKIYIDGDAAFDVIGFFHQG